jgi:hypothetical protein
MILVGKILSSSGIISVDFSLSILTASNVRLHNTSSLGKKHASS